MQSLNFELLRGHASDLAEHGAFAEHYAYTDPASAVVKLRIIAEQLVLHICDCLSLRLPPRPKLCDLLEDPSFQRVAPKAIRYKIDAVRIHGNHGAHGEYVSVDTALCMLRETYRVVCWFFLVYVRETNSECPSYREPERPFDVERHEADFDMVPCALPLEEEFAETVCEELRESDEDMVSTAESRVLDSAEQEGESKPEEEPPGTQGSVAAEKERDLDLSEDIEQFLLRELGDIEERWEQSEEPPVDITAMKSRNGLRQTLGKQGALVARLRGALFARKAARA